MFPSKLSLLLLGFIVLGTALTYVQAMPVDEYEDRLNDIDNEIFEEEIAADKDGAFDDEEVEEGVAEERNVFNELDEEAEAEDAKKAEEEIGADQDEDDFDDEFEEEVIADAEEESDEADKASKDEEEAAEEEEKSVADEEEAAEEEEKSVDDEEEAAEEEEEIVEAEERAAEEDEDIVDENGDAVKKPFPYNWYDKVKKFFKGRK